MNKNELNKSIMDEIKTQTRQIMPKRKKHRAEHQMTLGSLIKALSRERTGLPVLLSSVYQGYADKYPGTPHSYHGYPEDLAFVPTDIPITVAEFLTVCESTIGDSFTIGSPVWISELDTASKNGIADVISNADQITLVTKEIKEEEASDGTN